MLAQREADTPTARSTRRLGAKADIVVREDQHASVGERLVASDVIWMDMRIDEEADWLIAHLPDGGDKPVRQGSEQGVHQQHSVRADERADVAASSRALHHVDVAARVDGSQGDTRELVGLLRRSGSRRRDPRSDQDARTESRRFIRPLWLAAEGRADDSSSEGVTTTLFCRPSFPSFMYCFLPFNSFRAKPLPVDSTWLRDRGDVGLFARFVVQASGQAQFDLQARRGVSSCNPPSVQCHRPPTDRETQSDTAGPALTVVFDAVERCEQMWKGSLGHAWAAVAHRHVDTLNRGRDMDRHGGTLRGVSQRVPHQVLHRSPQQFRVA